MFGGKKKVKKPVALDPKQIYEPEPEFEEYRALSNWGKPQDPNKYSNFAKRRFLKTLEKIQTVFFIINSVLALFVFIGILYLVIGVDYETTVLYDGTELYCIVDADGNTHPYQPPRAQIQELQKNIRPTS